MSGLRPPAAVLLAVLTFVSAVEIQPLAYTHLDARVRVRDRSPKGLENRRCPALGPLGGKIAA